jgi:hypothetical protein
MNILRPLMRHASPSRTACVRIAATSEPASGSVMAIDLLARDRRDQPTVALIVRASA